MYHISDLKKYMRCPRLFVLDQREEQQERPQSFLRLDQTVTDLAAQKLGIRDAFTGSVGDPKEKALSALADYEWLIKARFEYDRLRVKVPFLHRLPDGSYELYFLMLGLFPMDNDMLFYSSMVWVLEGNGLRISKMHIMHLNASYVRNGELDVDQLFVVSDYFYNGRHHPSKPVEEAVRESIRDLHGPLRMMDAALLKEAPAPVHTGRCTGRIVCPYFGSCFVSEAGMPFNSILTLTASGQRYAMKQAGKEYLRDADFNAIEGTRQQYAQIMADHNGGVFVDRCAIQAWLDDVRYPIAFLDFEWERYAIPPFDGLRPFDVVPFEYSLHVLEEDGSIRHSVFLSVQDDRQDMIRSLLKEIPPAGSLIAYNAEGAEKIRLQEWMDQFPQYRSDLEKLTARMKDLQQPFMSGAVYDTKMAGSWTLKSILAAIGGQGYKDLDIHEGMSAVYAWRHLDREEENVDRQQIIDDLKAYCSMDSYAMISVFQWLQQLAGQK